MKRKYISIVILIIFSSSILILAQKPRPPRYTLEELTDPNSPSFVPYPFPKNDFEILEDFKYGIKKMRLFEEPGYDIFLFDKKDVFVDQIIRVEQRCLNFREDYYYLIQIKQKNEIVGVHAVDEFGLVMGGFMLETPEQKKTWKPFKDKEDVKELLEKTRNGLFIKKIELVHRISDICRIETPMWEVDTDRGTYFVDHFDNIWTIDYETSVSDEKIRNRNQKGIQFDKENKIKFLKKVSKIN